MFCSHIIHAVDTVNIYCLRDSVRCLMLWFSAEITHLTVCCCVPAAYPVFATEERF